MEGETAESQPSSGRLGGRPLLGGWYPGAWLVLLAAILPGLGSYYRNDVLAWPLGVTDGDVYMGVNYHVYHVATERALAGESFYEVAPEPAGETMVYLYPPITTAAFAPFSPFEWTTGYLLLTGVSGAASALATALLVQYVEGQGTPLGWVDVALIYGLFTLSIHVAATVFFGNINVLLGVAFVVGFWALWRDREGLAGVVFALAALFKLFPALVGVWLLREKRWTAVGAAVATGVGGLLAGILAFGPTATSQYFLEVVPGRTDSSAFVGGYPTGEHFYVTIQRPLSHLIWSVWPTAPYALLPASAVAVAGAILAYFYRFVGTERERLMAILATVVVTIVVIPSLRLYAPLVFFPFVALLYTWQGGPGRYAFLAGGLLMAFVARPEAVVTAASALGPLEPLVAALGTFATIQLYAFGLVLGGCAWALRTDSEQRDQASLE